MHDASLMQAMLAGLSVLQDIASPKRKFGIPQIRKLICTPQEANAGRGLRFGGPNPSDQFVVALVVTDEQGGYLSARFTRLGARFAPFWAPISDLGIMYTWDQIKAALTPTPAEGSCHEQSELNSADVDETCCNGCVPSQTRH